MNDVISRLQRVYGFVDVLGAESMNELHFRLSESPQFNDCSPFVRSQLKRAATLYREFHSIGHDASKGVRE